MGVVLKPALKHAILVIGERSPPIAKQAVLVVDDEAPVRATLTRFLKLLGVDEVLEATNGQEAVEQLKASPQVRLVLLDLKMPERDGVQALTEMKAINPLVKIVILTGYPFYKEADQAAQTLGAFDFLVKPVDLDYLERIVTLTLDQDHSPPPSPTITS